MVDGRERSGLRKVLKLAFRGCSKGDWQVEGSRRVISGKDVEIAEFEILKGLTDTQRFVKMVWMKADGGAFI